MSKDIHINVKMILGNAQADMNMLGWYINILGLVVLVFAIRSSRLCWLALAMIKRRWSSNITSGKLSLRFASCHCQSCSCKLFSKDVSCRWKTSKYEYTQCQQILKYPCSSDWIFTAGLKSLWNILNWGIVTMRRCFTSWREQQVRARPAWDWRLTCFFIFLHWMSCALWYEEILRCKQSLLVDTWA